MFIPLIAGCVSWTLGHHLRTPDRGQWDGSADQGACLQDDILSLIPEPTWKERTESSKSSSDFHKHTMACTQKQIRKYIIKMLFKKIYAIWRFPSIEEAKPVIGHVLVMCCCSGWHSHFSIISAQAGTRHRWSRCQMIPAPRHWIPSHLRNYRIKRSHLYDVRPRSLAHRMWE